MPRPRRNIPVKSYVEPSDLGTDNEDDEEKHESDLDSEASEASSLTSLKSLTHASSQPDDHSTNPPLLQLPTTAQIAETRELIRQGQEVLALADLECKELEQKLEIARLRRSRLAKEVFAKYAFVSPIRRLPQDILALVFIIHTREYKQSPWELMQVNRTWRATALSTRSIWAGIEVTSFKWKTKGYPRNRDGREVCGTVEQFLRAVTRARGALLDLKFYCDHPRPGPEYWTIQEEGVYNEIIASFNELCQHLSIGSLEIGGRSLWRVTKPTMTNLKASHLRVLKLGVVGESMLSTLGETACNLQVLELEWALLSYIDNSERWWEGLECLKIRNSSNLYVTGDGVRIKRILEQVPSIRNLDLCNCIPYAFQADSLSFPFLEKMCLRSMHAFPHVNVPNLTHLTLVQTSIASTTEFPLLTYLEVKGYSPSLRYIRAPLLHTLTLDNSPIKSLNTEMAQKTWLKSTDEGGDILNPVVFHYRKMPISSSVLILVLVSMTRLEELHIEEVDIKLPLIRGLAPRKSTVPCPQLQVVNFVLKKTRSRAELEETAKNIRKSFQLRAKDGFPVREAKICLADSLPDDEMDLIA